MVSDELDVHVNADGSITRGARPAAPATAPSVTSGVPAPAPDPETGTIEYEHQAFTYEDDGSAHGVEAGPPQTPWEHLPVVREEMAALPAEWHGPVWSTMQTIGGWYQTAPGLGEGACEDALDARWGADAETKYAYLELAYSVLPERWQRDLVAERPGRGRLWDHPETLMALAEWGEKLTHRPLPDALHERRMVWLRQRMASG